MKRKRPSTATTHAAAERGDDIHPNGSAGSVDGHVFEISTLSEIGVGEGATSWSEPDDPAERDWKSEQAVQRPIDVFPSRLLDLCNQDTPLTFLTFLPNGCQDRSKWLAHGHHSEVFEVASPLKRTVLKVIPVTGDFTEQRIDAIAAGHRVLRVSCLQQIKVHVLLGRIDI
ncbi:uncharacterized protein LOC119455180 [Dermacentor silvarum]|uniref:uncharacterized protein LOC119455180 n=1 Tax=Dermacentor silvarum TaxID=543639 RepID=UPI0021009642|nr:uncharacterized protein LOC119455180 [Dermacentor silvarum]